MPYVLAVTTLVTQIMAVATGAGAIVGTVLAAAKWRREDTGLMVNQATALVTGMDTIVIELRRERDEARKERDEQRTENVALRAEVGALRAECAHLRQEITKLRDVMERYQERGGES
jgi:uncharacterized coiled-coil DUF342 family protein